jgi:phage portal protein BeeE
MLLGIPGDNTYANYQEANRAFYRLTVLPLVAWIANAEA